MDIQKRNFSIDKLEVRGGENGEPVVMKGHAAVFNQWSSNLGWNDYEVYEEILPGAFTRTLKEGGLFKDGIRSFFNHESLYILASTASTAIGTLRLWEDKEGLAFEMEPIDTVITRSLVIEPMRAGLINQMSFGFCVPEGGDTVKRNDNVTRRSVNNIDLIEISPVIMAAYPQTDVGVRSILQGVGIDPEKLSEIIAREERTSEDYGAIEVAIAALRSYLPAESEPGNLEPDGESQRVSRELEMLRLRLEVGA